MLKDRSCTFTSRNQPVKRCGRLDLICLEFLTDRQVRESACQRQCKDDAQSEADAEPAAPSRDRIDRTKARKAVQHRADGLDVSL
jgi:hypothetical protein